MILVDTSVWVDHLHKSDRDLSNLLAHPQIIYTHRFIIGELAVGYIKNRQRILDLMDTLPKASAVSDSAVMSFIEREKLYGKGLSFVDAHLISSAKVNNLLLHTKDKNMLLVCKSLGCHYLSN